MSIFGKSSRSPKPASNTRVARPTISQPRMHSYYTSTQRTDSRPEIRTSETWPRRFGRLIRSSNHSWMYVAGMIIFVAVFVIISSASGDALVTVDRQTPAARLLQYEQYAGGRLRSSIFNSSKLTLRADELRVDMLKQFPELGEVHVGSVLLGKKPVFKLTRLEMPYKITSLGKTYLVSSDGVVVDTEDKLPELAAFDVLTLVDDSGVVIAPGQKIMRSDDSTFYKTAKKMFEQRRRGVESIRITQVPREAYIRPVGLSYDLRVFLDDPATDQIARFFAVEKVLEGRGEVPQKYIDLRIGEKVFWQ
jgi:hypothetical protein